MKRASGAPTKACSSPSATVSRWRSWASSSVPLMPRTPSVPGGPLLVAGPPTRASEANISIRNAAAHQAAAVVEVDHSRGLLTSMNALQAQVNAGQSGVALSSVTFNGAAANAQSMANLCASASNGNCVVQQATHIDDLVGKWIGSNPPTGGAEGASILNAHTNYTADVPAPFLPNGQRNPDWAKVDGVWGTGQFSQPVIVLPMSVNTGVQQ